MRLDMLLWVATAAYALHAFEEYAFDWLSWARAVIHLPVTWTLFYLANATVIVIGIVSASVANHFPVIALSYPALLIINALFFHIAPFLLKRFRFSPGLFTSVFLFLPIGAACFLVAVHSQVVTNLELLYSFLLGAFLMFFPLACLKLSRLPYFEQS